MTLDRYAKLFAGSGNADASLLDEYLARANTDARLAQLSTEAAAA